MYGEHAANFKNLLLEAILQSCNIRLRTEANDIFFMRPLVGRIPKVKVLVKPLKNFKLRLWWLKRIDINFVLIYLAALLANIHFSKNLTATIEAGCKQLFVIGKIKTRSSYLKHSSLEIFLYLSVFNSSSPFTIATRRLNRTILALIDHNISLDINLRFRNRAICFHHSTLKFII